MWSELRERVAQYNSRTSKMSDVEKSHGWTVRDIPDQSGRIVVVTGANSGLGYEAALALAAAGAHVVAAARNEEKAHEIESLLIKSLKTGRRQRALSWQLRTACDLSRLWQGQGRGDEALTLLQSIYDQFTEGLNTADLIHAGALLEGLRANSMDRVASAARGH